MEAIGIIFLVLFLIGLGVSIYYALICMQAPRLPTKTLRPDEGPLLGYENDLNGNEEVVIPLKTMDQPDNVKQVEESPPQSKNKEIFLESPNKPVELPSSPECASTDHNTKPVVISIDHELIKCAAPISVSATTASEPMKHTSRDIELLKDAISIPLYNQMNVKILANSDEEDGLIQQPSILHNSSHAEILNNSNDHHQKRVHFMPVPIKASNDAGECSDVEDSTYNPSSGPRAFSSHNEEQDASEKPLLTFTPNEQTLDKLEIPKVSIKGDTTELSDSSEPEENSWPLQNKSSQPDVIVVAPVGWHPPTLQSLDGVDELTPDDATPSPPKKTKYSNVTASMVNHEPDSIEQDAPLKGVTPKESTPLRPYEGIQKYEGKDIRVKVLFPPRETNRPSPSPSPEELSSIPSDTDTSEPEVTEYSFVSGPMVPSTSDVLANEISYCLEPKVLSFISIPETYVMNTGRVVHTKGQPPTPICESSSSSNDTSIDEENLQLLPPVIISNKITCPLTNESHSINTPPSTPPEVITPNLTILGNPSAEFFSLTKPEAENERSPTYIVIKPHGEESQSSSCSSSSSSEDDEVPEPIRFQPQFGKIKKSQIPKIKK